MNVMPKEHPHRFWVRFVPATLVGSFALLWVADHQLGWGAPAMNVSRAVSAMALMLVMGFAYRTMLGLVGAVAAFALVVILGYTGATAVHHGVLARDGEPTVAEVVAVTPGGRMNAEHCELRRAIDGGDIRELRSNGCHVGDRVGVTFDPAGRVASIEGTPDPDGRAFTAEVLAAVLAVLVLSMPLWGRFGPPLERSRETAADGAE
ncbi:hypothetical protein [Kitasatospora sp. CB01950]|uniref:hypothetical protein n=1 Tax=Kitasatospora sp. CB01950 TaxID=1703930 RepID=UPI00093EA418|nr:hypothetical protein [Kitasatospora sp. CB01950]OKJ06662.1 hypothetical protein AMK19_22465 [Kitasatospora sp. CB01950]